MLEESDVLGTFSDLRRDTLRVWIDRGWIVPRREGGAYLFREIDVARIRLIREFHSDLEFGEDAMDVILPLLDQVHGLRRQLHRLAKAVDAQPEDVRRRVAESLAGAQD